jgi:Chlorophyll A-B binding protein
MTFTSKRLIFAVCALLLVAQGVAFQARPSHRVHNSRQSNTTPRVLQQRPRWTDLPRERNAIAELSGFEIITGRLAMLGFCGLLAREVVSGESFGEQIIHAFSTATLANLPI